MAVKVGFCTCVENYWHLPVIDLEREEFHEKLPRGMKYREDAAREEYFIPRGDFLWNTQSERSITDICIKPASTWRIFSREQAKSECDWLVMTSVFVASQSSCFFLCSREQIRQVENWL